ncbi:MAG: peptide chain release factor-like protein, partial [Myxococcota bacterium]|nr:peptide chain release factor-like protein [Myxococcota bacterium]
TCQDEKSQHKNKAKALKILRSRVLEEEQRKVQAEQRDQRLAQVGTGDRSERIRTYNFPQNRVSDHRIGLTLYALEKLMEGDMDELIQAVSTHFEAEALKAAERGGGADG